MKKITLTDQSNIDLAGVLDVYVRNAGVACVRMMAPIVAAIEEAESLPEPPPKKVRKKKLPMENT